MLSSEEKWNKIIDEFKSCFSGIPEDMTFETWLKENYYAPEKRLIGLELEKMDNSVYIAEQKLEDYLKSKFPDIDINWIHKFIDSLPENWGGQELVDELSNFPENDKRFAGFREVNKF